MGQASSWCAGRDKPFENRFQNTSGGLTACKPGNPQKKGPRESNQHSERPTISKNLDDDNVIFIGDSRWVGHQTGELKEYSITTGALFKDYGKVYAGPITSMTQNSEKKFLFTSDAVGNIKGWDVEKHCYIANFGAVVENGKPAVLTDLTTRQGDGHDTYLQYENGFLTQKALRYAPEKIPNDNSTVKKFYALERDD